MAGILIVFVKYGDIDSLSAWLWIKIALVVIFSASIGLVSATCRRFRAGDKAVGVRFAMTGKINMSAGPLIIPDAVFAFC